MSAPEPLSREERSMLRTLAWSKDIGGKSAMELPPRLVMEMVDRAEAVEAERDAWRALGREQMAACWDRSAECAFCRRIAALLGEEPTDA